MNGGPIGGTDQSGKWKIHARFNKPELERRCAKVAEYRTRIDVSCTDGSQYLQKMKHEQVFFFIDPPYYVKGETLYLNAMSHQDHGQLAETLNAMQDMPWILTYDDCSEIRRMYKWATIRPFALRYVAAARRQGREVVICPKWMKLPSFQPSASIQW